MVLADILSLAILIILSGFFSGIEIAFFSVSNIRVRHFVEKGLKGSDTLQKLKSDPHKLLITILIGNNLVNIGASAMATVMALDYFGSKGAGIAVGVMTFIILIFGEITPKSFATIHAERIALLIARPMLILQWCLMPVTFFLDRFIKMLTAAVGGSRLSQRRISEEELKSIVNISHEEGGIGKQEKEMIHKIFEFDDTSAGEIMIPRTDMILIDINTPIMQLIEFLKKNKFTRVPVFEGNPDRITGILYVKNLLPHIDKLHSRISMKDLVKPVLFAPSTKKIDALLREFQKKKQHMAIVVDEHGGIIGLVTLEDVLEEIVGEIYDENETKKNQIRVLDQKTALVDGETNIEKVNERLKIGLRGDKKAPIAGFVLEKMGRIPNKGEKIWFMNFDIIIEDVEDNRISMLRIEKKKGAFRK